MERRYSESKDSRELAFAGQEFLFPLQEPIAAISARITQTNRVFGQSDTACGAIEQADTEVLF